MRVLIVLAKAPIPGFSKTRLVGEGGVDAELAARIADAFLRDTLRNCRRAEGAELVLCYAPAIEREYFRRLDPEARLVPQSEGDVGARLREVFRFVFAAGATRAVVVGSDTPHLLPEWIEAAFASLESSEAVLGPVADGGYYLIGLRRRCEELFQGIPWSTPEVAEQTRERARAAGIVLAEAPATFDVDRPEDLVRLRELLAVDGDRAPHTASVLRGARR